MIRHTDDPEEWLELSEAEEAAAFAGDQAYDQWKDDQLEKEWRRKKASLEEIGQRCADVFSKGAPHTVFRNTDNRPTIQLLYGFDAGVTFDQLYQVAKIAQTKNINFREHHEGGYSEVTPSYHYAELTITDLGSWNGETK
jgi:hypothetical protein